MNSLRFFMQRIVPGKLGIVLSLCFFYTLLSTPVCAVVYLSDDFESGMSNWTVSGSGEAGTSTQTAQSSSRSLYLRGEAVRVRSASFDLAAETTVNVSLWIRRGADSFSEDPDNNEDLIIYYRNSSNSWIELERFAGEGTPGQVYLRSYTLPAAALHGSFVLAFEKEGGSDGNWDYWHVDDVLVESVPAPVACPDNSSYTQIFYDDFSDGDRNGWTPVEFDYSISNYPGESVNDVGQTSNGEWNNDWTVNSGVLWWNRGGNSGSADEYGMLSYDLSGSRDTSVITEYSISADLNGYPTDQNNDVGIVFGYVDDSNYYVVRWTKFGNYYASNPSGYPGTYRRLILARVSGGTAQELGYYDGFYDGGEFELKVTVRPDGIHVCVDGNSMFVYNGSGRPALNLFGLYTFDNDDGVSFDDVEVRANVLQCFNDDFNTSPLSSDWAVSNSNGSFGDPRIVNGRLRLTDASGSVATAASLLRRFPGAGNRIVYEFDHYAYGGSGADGIVVTLSDAAVTPRPGGYGGSLGYAQRCGIDGFTGGWLGVGIDEYGNFRNDQECRGDGGSPTGRVLDSVSVRGSGSGVSGYLLHGESGGLTPPIDRPNNSTPSYGHRYRITVDHSDNVHAYVTVERDSGSGFQTLIPQYDAKAEPGQAAVPINWLISMTGSTGGSTNIHEIDNLEVCATSMLPYVGIDHYRFYHDGAGMTCAPEDIQVRACLDVDCTVEFAGNVDVTLSPSGWEGGSNQSFVSGSSLKLWHTSPGTVTLDIAGNNSQSVAVKPPRCFVGTTEQGDCDLEFFNSGFIVDIPDVTACRPSSGATIQAVRTDATTQTCVANSDFANTTTDVNFWSSYLNPGTGTEQVQLNGTQLATASPGTTVSLAFDNNAQAPLSLRYPDAGQLQLSARYEGTGVNDAGLVLLGNDSFVSSPAGLCIYSDDANADCASGNGSCSPFRKVDQAFNLKVKGVCWETDSDTDLCSSNPTTPNYQQNGIAITHALVAPTSAGSSPGTIAVGSIDMVAADNGEHVIADQSVTEVGVFRFTATAPPYFGVNLPAAVSANIGRFTPDHFVTSIIDDGDFQDACSGFTYSGQPFGYTPTGRPQMRVSAVRAGGGVTVNYRDGFVKLTDPATQINMPAVTQDSSNLGADAATLLNLTWSPAASQLIANDDGTLDFSLGNDQFVYTRESNALVAPFDTDIRLPVNSVSDSDGVTASDLPRSFTPGATEIRYGRLLLENAYGPETMPLNIPLRTEFYNGTAFIPNDLDSCTAYDSVDLQLSGYQGNLVDGDTAASGIGALSSGQGNALVLSAPGVGHDGSVDLTLDLSAGGANLPWLQYDWDGDGVVDNPTAKATFGIYKGNPRLIYTRESIW